MEAERSFLERQGHVECLWAKTPPLSCLLQVQTLHLHILPLPRTCSWEAALLAGAACTRPLMERALQCLWARMSLHSLTPLHHGQPCCCHFQWVTQSASSRASRHRCDKQRDRVPWGDSALLAHPPAIQGCCQPGFGVPHTLCLGSHILCFVGGRRLCPWFIEHVSAAHFS